MRPVTKILIVDDEKPIRTVLTSSLEDENFVVKSADSGESGVEVFKEFQPHVVLLDIWMDGELDGLEVLKQIRAYQTPSQVIMMSGHGTIETAVKSTKLGAWDFVEKPLSMDKILILISNILNFQKQKKEKNLLLNRLRKNIAMVGESQPMKNLKQMISRVGKTNAWVLVTGENGTGKELVAQNLHYLSPRASQVFLDVNCAAIPADLVESELFGYEKGAFTGATQTKVGKFEQAHQGTIFLDEIGDMSLEAQSKILKILQEQRFRRVGGIKDIQIDVRVIAATNKDLKQAIKDGSFREDLFYRLNVIPFHVPSLSERREDIGNLVTHFSSHFSKESGGDLKTFSECAMQKLIEYNWPGNVRELKNFIERLYILTSGQQIEIQDLYFAGLSFDIDSDINSNIMNFRDARSEFEKNYIVKKIEENNGNITKTAENIGLERSYLHRKIKSYGIDI